MLNKKCTFLGFGQHKQKYGTGLPPCGWLAKYPWIEFRGPGRCSTRVCTELIVSILQALGIDPNNHGPKTGNIINEATFVIEGHALVVNMDRDGGEAVEAEVGQQEEFLNAHRDQEHIDREVGEALEDEVEQQEQLEDVDMGQEHMEREGGEALEDVVEKLEEFEDVTRDQESENEDIMEMFDKVNASETQSSKTSDNLVDEHMEPSDSELSDLNNSATVSNSEQLSGSEKEDNPHPSKRSKQNINNFKEVTKSTTPPPSISGAPYMAKESSRPKRPTGYPCRGCPRRFSSKVLRTIHYEEERYTCGETINSNTINKQFFNN